MKIFNTPTIPTQDNIRVEAIGLITEEIVVGVNVIKDIFASVRDFFGGRCTSYEDIISNTKSDLIDKMTAKAVQLGANSIVNFQFNIFTIGSNNSMFCMSATGTAVKVTKN